MIDMSKWQQIAKEKIHVRPATQGRLAGKIAIVTGAAQGFGGPVDPGIQEGLAEQMPSPAQPGREGGHHRYHGLSRDMKKSYHEPGEYSVATGQGRKL